MARRASAPEAAATTPPSPAVSTSYPISTAPLPDSTTKEAIEDEELMEGISRQGRRPSDDPSFASTEMSPSSSVDSRMLATAQSVAMETVGVAVVPEEPTVAVVEERKQEANGEVEKLEDINERQLTVVTHVFCPIPENDCRPACF
jgi:hypothetical protein